MNNLYNKAKNRSIHIDWTAPRFLKAEATGTPLSGYTMSDSVLLTQLISLMSMKAYIEWPTMLFTDIKGKEFYDKIGLTKFYDEVDVDFLTMYDHDYKFDRSSFYTSAKTAILTMQEPPFFFLDADLFITQPMPVKFLKNDLVFAHPEICRKEYLCEIKDFEDMGYEVPITFDDTIMMPNTALMYMNNEELQTMYRDAHLSVILHKYKKEIPKWLWLYSDQGCLGQLIHHNPKFKTDCFKKQIFTQFKTDTESVLTTREWVHPVGYDESKDLHFYHSWFNKEHVYTDPALISWYKLMVIDFVENKGMQDFLEFKVIRDLIKSK